MVIRWSSGSLVLSIVVGVWGRGVKPPQVRHDEQSECVVFWRARAARQPKPNLPMVCWVKKIEAGWGFAIIIIGLSGSGILV